jgi:hypothetical protein
LLGLSRISIRSLRTLCEANALRTCCAVFRRERDIVKEWVKVLVGQQDAAVRTGGGDDDDSSGRVCPPTLPHEPAPHVN